ncbi:DNA-binding response regulator, partial [Streptomyces hydrogenans]
MTSQLRTRPEINVTEWSETADPAPEVVVLVVDTVDEDVLRLLRHIRRTSTSRPVLVTTDIDEQKLVSAAECGVAGVIRRAEATPE